MKSVTIVEVGLRDGLQNESVFLTVDQRYNMLKGLIESGLKRIEVGAFVRADKVPQMAGSKELLEKANHIKSKAEYAVLVPNMHGWEEAGPLHPKEVALFASCTESFSLKNINCTIEESLERFKPVIQAAKKKKIRIRGYLSVCFGCPFEGYVSEKKVIELVKKLKAMKVDEISIGDTVGVATPGQVRSLFKKLKKVMPIKKLAGHFHDTRGQALANIYAAYEEGVRVFDSSIGGLGGCPYAPGSTGNVATEDVIYMFDGMKIKTGVSLEKLRTVNKMVEGYMGKSLHSKLSKAGVLKPQGPVKR